MLARPNIDEKPARIDWVLVCALLGLMVLGAMFIHSARYATESGAGVPWFKQYHFKQIIYYVTFPEREIWLTYDTLVYQIRNDKLVTKTATFAMAEFTVFHLALNSRMQDYGLRNTLFTATEVTKDGDLVITTWSSPPKNRQSLGNILVSVKNKQLFGVVFQDPKGGVIRKQFFEEYLLSSGLSFPGKIVEINTTEGRDSYQVTTYKNIVVDETQNDNKYFYNISGLHL